MDIKAFEKLTYGVYIVSAGNAVMKNAFVATTAFQVTASPNQIAVACNKNNFTLPLVMKNQAFAVSVLKQHYTPATMGTFGFRSGKDFDKFAHCEFVMGTKTNTPIVITDTLAWFECKLTQQADVGTHILLIGEVLDCRVLDEGNEPLTYAYYHQVKGGRAPENAPHAQEEK